jgi:hypothetical protein
MTAIFVENALWLLGGNKHLFKIYFTCRERKYYYLNEMIDHPFVIHFRKIYGAGPHSPQTLLVRFYKKGYYADSGVIKQIVAGKNLRYLKWIFNFIINTGVASTQWVSRMAACDGSQEMLQWIVDRRYQWDPEIRAILHACEHYKVLEWVIMKGYFNENIIQKIETVPHVCSCSCGKLL